MSDRLLDLALRLRDLERAAGLDTEAGLLASELVRELGRREGAALRGEAEGLLAPAEPVPVAVQRFQDDTDERFAAAVAEALREAGLPPDAEEKELALLIQVDMLAPRPTAFAPAVTESDPPAGSNPIGSVGGAPGPGPSSGPQHNFS